jgi:hypothetical protein
MTIALSDIQEQVLQRCDMERSNFISDGEMLAMINASAAELMEFLQLSYGDDYYVTESFHEVSGSTLSLPSDHFKLLAIDVAVGDGYRPLDRWNLNDRSSFSGSVPAMASGIRYRQINSNIRFLPETGLGTNVFRLWYVPRYESATSLDDTLPDLLHLQHWSEYIVVDCCIKVLTKEESDASVFMAQKNSLVERIKNASKQRDAGKPNTMYVADYMEENIYGIPFRRR